MRAKMIFTAIILTAFLFGCETGKSKYKYRVESSNGNGWDWSTSTILADSIQMISTKEADVWVDGLKLKVYAENYVRFYQNNH